MPYDPETGLEIIQEELQSSPTAYINAANPTPEDLAADRRRMALEKSIQSADDKRLQERWYGSPKAATMSEAPKRDIGFFEKGLTSLAAPLRATVGAAQYVKGKVQGEDVTLKGTINQNIKSGGETWGGFLESLGAPRIVSIPIGFAMDVAFDPLNVAMMGTSSLVGKTAYGLKKAGFGGGGLALKEQALKTGYGVLKHIPFTSLPKTAQGAEQVAVGSFLRNLPKSNVLRQAWEKEASAGMKARAFAHGLGERAIKTTEEFDRLTGRNFMDILKKEAQENAGPWGLPFRPSAKVEEFFKKNGWDEVVKSVKYSPNDFGKAERLVDLEKKKMRAEGRFFDGDFTKNPENIPIIEAALDEMAFTKKPPTAVGEAADDLAKVPSEAQNLVPGLERVTDDARGVLSGEESIIAQSAMEFEDFGQKIAAETAQLDAMKAEIERLRNSGINPTGFQKYDDFVRKIADVTKIRYKDKVIPVGEKVMKFMDLSNKLFSMFKVALSPSAWVNGIVGNPTMAHLLGINVLNPEYFASVYGATGIISGKWIDQKFLEKITPFMDKVKAMVEKMPGYAHQTLSVDARVMSAMQDRFVIGEAATAAEKAGVAFDENAAQELIVSLRSEKTKAVSMAQGQKNLGAREAEVLRLKKAKASQAEIQAAEKEVQVQLARNADARLSRNAAEERKKLAAQIGKTVEKEKFKRPPSPSELAMMTEEELKALGVNRSDIPKDYVTEELFGGAMMPYLKSLKKTSEGSGAMATTAKFLYAVGTKPGSWYSKIDGAYKLGTWHHLIANGLTEGEMRLVSRIVPGLKDGVAEVVHKGAELRYLISPEVALDVVNEAYMQYAAMPNIVSFLRGLPILGGTFIAFPYAMTSKTMKAIAYNPQAFNKVQFLIQDVGGRKTPTEKAALQSEYYNQLNSPWQLRIPLFKDNPIYLNLTNMLSFASLNQFMPSERHFDDPFANVVAQAVDKTPFFKNPWGGALLDTVIFPMFLHGEEAPQGYFGQRIWPIDATPLEKVGYGARNLGESFTPSILGYAGLSAALLPGLQNPSLVEAMPSSRYRGMVYALSGKNPVGKQTREPPASKTARTFLRQTGFGFTPVETSYSKK